MTATIPLEYRPASPTTVVSAISLYADPTRTGEPVFTGPMTLGTDGVYRTSAALSDGVFYAVEDCQDATGPYQDRNDVVVVVNGAALVEEPRNFATVQDLAVRLGRAFTPAQVAQVDALLSDASAALRLLIGQDVTAGRATFTTRLDRGQRWIYLPQLPVRSIESISVYGTLTQGYALVDQQLYLTRGYDVSQGEPVLDDRTFDVGYGYDGRGGYLPVTVSYSYGFLTVPPELKSWALVIASQLLGRVESSGTLGSAGVASESIGQYSVSLSSGSAAAAASEVPSQAAEALRARYGISAYVTDVRRSRHQS